METNDSNVFLPRRLLSFDQSCCSIDANDETACDFGIERSGMTCLFDTEDTFDPGDDFVGGGVGGFVEVDDSIGDVIGERTGEG